jgi:hypothetical protein
VDCTSIPASAGAPYLERRTVHDVVLKAIDEELLEVVPSRALAHLGERVNLVLSSSWMMISNLIVITDVPRQRVRPAPSNAGSAGPHAADLCDGVR